MHSNGDPGQPKNKNKPIFKMCTCVCVYIHHDFAIPLLDSYCAQKKAVIYIKSIAAVRKKLENLSTWQYFKKPLNLHTIHNNYYIHGYYKNELNRPLSVASEGPLHAIK